jgi:predicted DNA-binding protein
VAGALIFYARTGSVYVMHAIKPVDTTNIRIPRDLAEKLRQLAIAHERSLAAELRVAIAAYVQDAEQ